MLSLNTLQNIKPSPLQLLDISYIIVLLPLLLIVKIPMLVFGFLALVLIKLHKNPANPFVIFGVFILGIFALFLSLYGAFSFQGLSRLKLFLELLIYILIVVVAMQRLTRVINFYLLLSPILFLALSLFFFQGIIMLVYVIFEIFFLLWMILSHRMHSDLVESFRASMVMFMYSLPWVVLLFIFFPRISFEHPSYGFRGEIVRHTGHDGTMFLDNKSLLVPSNRVVMEIGFEDAIPPLGTLYFRGSTLYVDKKDHWEPLPKFVDRGKSSYYRDTNAQIKYKVTLYPTNKKWLYLLDMPSYATKNSKLDRDLITTVKKTINEPIYYQATSNLSDRFKDQMNRYTYKVTTNFDRNSNPIAYRKSLKIKNSIEDKEKRAKAIIRLFQEQNLTYSLRISSLDLNNSTDDFLFSQKYGYCVHFASSFVTMARMADIPSRIVTGYKSDRSNSLNNYLPVREKDAHAWAELYIKGEWRRYEATSTASIIETTTEEEENQTDTAKNQAKINLYLMYIKYKVETWILYYSNIRQLQLLKYAKDNPKFILYFTLSILAMILSTFMIISYFRRPSCGHIALCMLNPLLKRLKEKGYKRAKDETLHQYLYRYSRDNPNNNYIEEIDRYYEKIYYGGDESKETIKRLKKLVQDSVKMV
ncbi:MAG: transglutaminaseTgpA domain-containing protein [Sulfurovum sp.]